MKIYQIDSSARKKGSTSRALAKKLLDKIKKPEDEVIYRDLDDEMLFVSGLTFIACCRRCIVDNYLPAPH